MDPGTPMDGQQDDSPTFEHGTDVTFSCNFGYTLVGLKTITCMDGSWSGEKPTCHAQCDQSSLPTGIPPSNGQYQGGTAPSFPIDSGTSFTVVCDTNYELQGTDTFTCTGPNTWDLNVAPTCVALCSETSVPTGIPPTDGQYQDGTVPTFPIAYDNSITVECNANYRVEGSDTFTCSGVNNWTPDTAPTCVAQCDQSSLPTGIPPSNGQYQGGTAPSFPIDSGTSFTVVCDTNYELQGTDTFTCTGPNTWDLNVAPTCVALCSETSVPTGIPPTDGQYQDGTVPTFPIAYDNSITVECNANYRVEGSDTFTCSGVNNWTPDTAPTCVAQCDQSSLPTGIPPSNGQYQGGTAPSFPIDSGTSFTVVCDTNYELQGTDTFTCTGPNTWDLNVAPTCVALCSETSVPTGIPPTDGQYQDGTVPTFPIAYDNSITVECNANYRVEGSDTFTCSGVNNWTPDTAPTCVAQCDQSSLPTGIPPSNGQYQGGTAPSFPIDSGTSFTVVCDTNYELQGTDTFTCTGPNTWDLNVAPTCVALCSETSVPTGIPPTDGQYQDGTVPTFPIAYDNSITVECNANYRVEGSDTFTCSGVNNWTPDTAPTCVAQCDQSSLPTGIPPSNGQYQGGTAPSFPIDSGTSFTVVCDTNYELQGTDTFTCTGPNTWDLNVAPTCVALCSETSVPTGIPPTDGQYQDGTVPTFPIAYDNSITVECNANYRVEGSDTFTCSGVNNWTPDTAPTCVAQCDQSSLPTGIPPSNGQYQGGTAPSFPIDSGTSFTVVCDTNYELQGTDTFTCTGPNTWDLNVAPTCVALCSETSVPTGIPPTDGQYQDGTVPTFPIAYDNSITVECNANYRVEGSDTFTCSGVNNWTPDTAPTCVAQCDQSSLPTGIPPSNGQYQGGTAPSFPIDSGTSFTVVCDTNYELQGTDTFTCTGPNTWDLNVAPTCVALCSETSVPTGIPPTDGQYQDGTVPTFPIAYDNSITVECNANYRVEGSDTFTCSGVNNWTPDTAPTCVAQCDQSSLPTGIPPSNGQYQGGTAPSFPIDSGTSFTVVCDTNYELQGTDTFTCTGPNTWDLNVAPTCVALCSETSVPTGIPPTDGQYQDGTVPTFPIAYDNSITVECNANYRVEGSDTFTCSGVNNWTPDTAPTCVAQCDQSSLPTGIPPSNGQYQGGTAPSFPIDSGTSFTVVCDTNYELQGTDTFTCTGPNTWDLNVAPTCVALCSETSVPTGIPPTDGQYQDGTVPTFPIAYDNSITVECNANYRVEGSDTFTCSGVNNWTPDTAPTCVAQCDQSSLPTGIPPSNGQYQGGTAPSFPIDSGTSFTVVCDTNYELQGTDTFTCTGPNTWDLNVAPTCVALCSETSVPTGIPPTDGQYQDGTVPTFPIAYDNSITVECNANYRVEGSDTFTCSGVNNWTPDTAPTCVAQCDQSSLPTGIPPSNGQYQGGTAPSFPIDSGTSFTVVCDTNYELQGTDTFTCTGPNTWDLNVAPTCVALCSETSVPTGIPPTDGQYQDGTVPTFPIAYDNSITVECNANYRVEGSDTFTCSGVNNWTPDTAPTCVAQCDQSSLPTGIPPSNGQYQGGTAPSFPIDSGTSFTVVCDTNYELQGTDTFTCTGPNTWDLNVAPTCVALCSETSVPTGIPPTDGQYQDGTVPTFPIAYDNSITVECNANYRVEGSDTFTCSGVNNWTPDTAPTCVAQCDQSSLPTGIPPSNGQYQGGTAPSFPIDSGTSFTVVCDTNYELQGTDTFTCTGPNTWDLNVAPTCVALCSETSVPTGIPPTDGQYQDGTVPTFPIAYDNSITVECNANYRVEGSDTFTCSGVNNWTPDTAPTCVAQCDQSSLPTGIPPSNGQYQGGTAPSFPIDSGTSFTVVCDTNYELQGTDTFTCTGPNTWDLNVAPTCVALCSETSVPTGIPPTDGQYQDGTVPTFPIAYDNSITVECNANYRVEGSDTFTCSGVNNWTPDTAPTCVAQCDQSSRPTGIPPSNGQYQGGTVPSFPVDSGTSFTVVCDTNYQLVGTGTFTCTAVNMWDSTTAPMCTAQCNESSVPVGIPPINGGYKDGITPPFPVYVDTSFTLVCDVNYHLHGNGTFTCTDANTWDSTTAPKCVEYAECSASGDPHYITFDGRAYDYQGACKYVLATSDCTNTVFELLQDGVVRVGGSTVTLPYRNTDASVHIKNSGRYVKLLADFGLVVIWDGHVSVVVQVPHTYWDGTCGLCGILDGNKANDLTNPDGALIENVVEFGNSWVANPDECVDVTEDHDPCANLPNEEVTTIEADCAILTDQSGPFADCHELVNPEVSYDACVFDTCAFPGNRSLCDNLENYARQCVENGGELGEWRDETFCGKTSLRNQCNGVSPIWVNHDIFPIF
ncbi:sushi, von Willebrand factor type A, EGF and pentraxin domain-containing protein 1-like [Glandiceps talaboti]